MSAVAPRQIIRAGDGNVHISPGDDLAAALIGARCDEAPERAARLHALCPHAHRVVTRLALGGAPNARDGERLLVEAMVSAAVRFGLHWPRAFGQTPYAEVGAAVQAGLHGDRSRASAALSKLLKRAPADAAHIAAGLGALGDPEAPMDRLSARLGKMLLAAEALIGMRALHAFVTNDRQACVGTARGLLTARAQHRNGMVTDFSSSAPSDRLLQKNGPIARAVAQARSLRQAQCAVLALDPCIAITVTFDMERAHA